MKFSSQRIQFGKKPAADAGEEPDGLPTPKKLEAMRLKMQSIERAKEVVAALPNVNESLHVVFQKRIDLADVLDAILAKYGTCERMVLATLTWNEANLKQMVKWLEIGRAS